MLDSFNCYSRLVVGITDHHALQHVASTWLRHFQLDMYAPAQGRGDVHQGIEREP